MKINLTELFVCPECKYSLALSPDYLTQVKDESDISDGLLVCHACLREFPIRDGIPYLYSDRIKNYLLGIEQDIEKTQDSVTIANIDYHNKVAEYYETDFSTAGIFENESGSQKRIPETLSYVSRHTDGEILVDVGCGTGNILRHASNLFKWAIGVDISVGMLNIAFQRGFDVCLGDGEKLPFNPESVDTITAFSVLHHLLDYKPFFLECSRVLKRGGSSTLIGILIPNTNATPLAGVIVAFRSCIMYMPKVRFTAKPLFKRVMNPCVNLLK